MLQQNKHCSWEFRKLSKTIVWLWLRRRNILPVSAARQTGRNVAARHAHSSPIRHLINNPKRDRGVISQTLTERKLTRYNYRILTDTPTKKTTPHSSAHTELSTLKIIEKKVREESS